MAFLDPITVVPERPCGGAACWARRKGGQSKAPCRRTMFPTRVHHLAVASGLLITGVLLIVAAWTLRYDLCVKVSLDLQVLDRYVQPSDHDSGFPQVIANLMAGFVILVAIFCIYRWSSYPKAPNGVQKSMDQVNAEPPELVQTMCRTFFRDLINIEIENFLVYFALMLFFTILASTGVYLPETVFWPPTSEDFQHMEDPTLCYTGFGIFGWFRPVIFAIVGGFALMCAISVINIYQDYVHLKQNEKMLVAGISDYADAQNNAILLNVRFCNATEAQSQDDGSVGQTDVVYVPAVEELNNSDNCGPDMKTV